MTEKKWLMHFESTMQITSLNSALVPSEQFQTT